MSVSCTIELLGGCLLDCSVGKQPVVALTSGESEFYGIVRTTACGIQTRQLLGQLGVPLRLDILCDSSAARVIRTRSDPGKDRHLSTKELWVHDALRKSEFSLRVVDTLLNWADVGTKSIKKDRLECLILQMPLSRGEERTTAVTIATHSFLSASPFNKKQRDVLRRRRTSSNGSSRTRLASLRARQDRRLGHCSLRNIRSPRTRADPLRGDDTCFAVVDCDTVLTVVRWIRADPSLEQRGSRDERGSTTHLRNLPLRRPMENSGQGSGDAGRMSSSSIATLLTLLTLPEQSIESSRAWASSVYVSQTVESALCRVPWLIREFSRDARLWRAVGIQDIFR